MGRRITTGGKRGDAGGRGGADSGEIQDSKKKKVPYTASECMQKGDFLHLQNSNTRHNWAQKCRVMRNPEQFWILKPFLRRKI